MKAIIVTGGCGFIGSHFVRLLLAQSELRVINVDMLTYAGDPERLRDVDGPRYRFVKGDIADRALIGDVFHGERPWAVVNFAAESHVDRSILDPSPFLHANVLGVQVLLEAARRHDVTRFVQISTDEVYGDTERAEPSEESSPLSPSSPYAASKAAADLLCVAYRRTYGLPVVIVRSSNNYGPYQFPEKLIPLVVRNALSGEPIPIYGDGLQRRDWLYVEENCRAIDAVLWQGRPGGLYNVATGDELTNREVVHTVCRLLAEEAALDLPALMGRIRSVTDRPGHDRRYAMRTHKIRSELGWSPLVPFEAGLRQTIRWYVKHIEWLSRVTAGGYREYYDAVYSRAWGQSR